MTDLEREINSVVATANATQPEPPAPTPDAHLCCQTCLSTRTYDPSGPMPTECGVNGCTGRVWVGETAEMAKNRATMAASATKPKAKRTSAPKAAPVAAQTEHPSVAGSVEVDGRTPKEKQQQAQAELAKKFNLNHTDYVEVGAGVVDAIGYTIWNDSRPEYMIQSPIESAVDFMRAYREDRKTHPGIRFDAAQIQELSPELRPCVFRNQLIASLVYPGGILRVKPGQNVKIGAKLSSTGSVVWSVLP